MCHILSPASGAVLMGLILFLSRSLSVFFFFTYLRVVTFLTPTKVCVHTLELSTEQADIIFVGTLSLSAVC